MGLTWRVNPATRSLSLQTCTVIHIVCVHVCACVCVCVRVCACVHVCVCACASDLGRYKPFLLYVTCKKNSRIPCDETAPVLLLKWLLLYFKCSYLPLPLSPLCHSATRGVSTGISVWTKLNGGHMDTCLFRRTTGAIL